MNRYAFIVEMRSYFLTKLILKILKIMKAHIQSNLKVPHPTLVALGISAAITVVVVGIFYMADTGMIGIEDAEALRKLKPKDDGE
ncbi:MAG TPA: hypothetical protein VHJ38_19110 [Nitrososphaeraceae archaeon]|nr:hypothetical protein [Nitrososphaeraceae archaeon]